MSDPMEITHEELDALDDKTHMIILARALRAYHVEYHWEGDALVVDGEVREDDTIFTSLWENEVKNYFAQRVFGSLIEDGSIKADGIDGEGSVRFVPEEVTA